VQLDADGRELASLMPPVWQPKPGNSRPENQVVDIVMVDTRQHQVLGQLRLWTCDVALLFIPPIQRTEARSLTAS
jgi:hypothetical protein